jgi:hypothetical protein
MSALNFRTDESGRAVPDLAESGVFPVYSDHNKTVPARYINMAELVKMAASPTTGPKDSAQALTPFTAQAKTKEAAQVSEYHALVIDHDSDSLSADQVRQLYRDNHLPALIYTTFRHSPEAPRYKVIVPFSRPMAYERYIELATGATHLLGTDKSQSRGAQVFYAPNKPAHDADYQFFDDTQGRTIDPLNEAHPFIGACADKYLDHIEQQREKAEQASSKPKTFSQSEGSIIEKVCAQYDIADELRARGYKQTRRNLLLSPTSSSGTPGVVVLTGDDGKQRVYSHHGETDPLSNLNHSGHALDVFDVICTLDYSGDTAAAVRELAPKVDEQAQKNRQREHAAKLAQAKAQALFTGSIEPTPGREQAPEDTSSEQEHGFRFKPVSQVLLDMRPPAWLVKDVIEQDCLAEVHGAPGEGKSFVAIDMAASIATGTHWHEHRTTPGAVFYIAGEGSNGIARRFKGWEIDREISLSDAPLCISSTPIALDNPESALKVKQAITAMAEQLQQTPVLIVVDTLARNFSGDENSTKDMSQFIRCMDALRVQWGATILIVHHTGKDVTKGARGSSVLKGAIDAEFSVTMDENKIICLEAKKMKEAELPRPMAFKLQGVRLPLIDEDGNDIWSCTPHLIGDDYKPPKKGSRGRGKNQTLARQILADLYREQRQRLIDADRDPDDAKVTISDWQQKCADTMIPRQRFTEIKKSLAEQGVIELINPYVILVE